MWTEEMTAICFGMKRAGMTTKAIAARLGVTEREVQRRCRGVAPSKLTGKGGWRSLKGRMMSGGSVTGTMEDL